MIDVRCWWENRNWPRLWRGVPALVAFALGLAMLVLGLVWRAERMRAPYQRLAEQAVIDKDYDLARLAYKRLISVNPERRSQYLFQLARLLMNAGRVQDATALLQAIAPHDQPGFLPAQLAVGQNLLSQTKVSSATLREAELHLLNVLQVAPSNPTAHELLGSLYCQSARWDKAIYHLRRAVEGGGIPGEAGNAGSQKPEARPAAALPLALAYKAAGQPAEAAAWASRAGAYFQAQTEATNNRALAISARLNWANTLVLQQRYSAAIAVLEKGWQQFGQPMFRRDQAEIFAFQAAQTARQEPLDFSLRLNFVREGLLADPGHEALTVHLLALTLFNPEAALVLAAVQEWEPAVKASAFSQLCHGLLEWRLGHQAEAMRAFVAMSTPRTPMVAVVNNLAYLLRNGGPAELECGLALSRMLVAQNANDPHLRDTCGLILARLKRYGEAMNDLEYALLMLPHNVETRETLRDVYAALGLTARAEKLLAIPKIGKD
jgi:tetratricopeptide (TPR) repeat protein